MRFLSQVYTIARGSVGGITYTANQWHQLIARARTSPVQPGTPFQTGIKSAFDVADDDWSGRSQEDRDLWDDYAATCVYSGPLGTYTIPGRQLFIGTVALVKYSNGILPMSFKINESPPLIAGFYNPGLIAVGTYGGVTDGIAVDVGIPSGENAVITHDISIAFDTTRNRFKGPWLSASKTIALGPNGTTVHTDIDRPAPLVGKIVFSRTRIFTADPLNGDGIPHRLSALFYLRHVVESEPPP